MSVYPRFMDSLDECLPLHLHIGVLELKHNRDEKLNARHLLTPGTFLRPVLRNESKLLREVGRAFSLQLEHDALEPRDLQLLELHLTLVGERMLRIVRECLHPAP